jgi:preprotein translocase subunit SecF
LLLGGGIIHDFAMAMIIGILIGTYSSIFIASPILSAWQTKGDGNK